MTTKIEDISKKKVTAEKLVMSEKVKKMLDKYKVSKVVNSNII